MKRRGFSELSLEELRGLETALKKVGKRAAALLEGVERLHGVVNVSVRLIDTGSK